MINNMPVPKMRAWRIGNEIVAARDVLEAMRVWLAESNAQSHADGPAEEIDPAQVAIQVENEDGSFRAGTVAEVMPGDDGEPHVVAFGECDCT